MKSAIKTFLAKQLKTFLRLFTSTRLGKIYFDHEVVRLLENSPKYRDKNWQITDMIYSASRRNLIGNPFWIPGSVRTTDVVSKYFSYLKKHEVRTDLPFLDLGCGAIHPYGVSTLFYLNGWDQCWALDISPCNTKRATEALADLVKDVLLRPEDFAFVTDANTILERARKFDLRALDRGDIKAGLADVSINYLVSDIAELPKLLGNLRFGTICSHTVWEHFLQFDGALKTIREICAPGGVHYHYIDFVDHRAYTEPEKYDFWSFLTSARAAFDPLCNKIRCSEMLENIKGVGFEVLEWEPEEMDYPRNLREQLHDDWKYLTEDDLKAIRVSCVLRS
jgi:SAM-dependent methyltransferase